MFVKLFVLVKELLVWETTILKSFSGGIGQLNPWRKMEKTQPMRKELDGMVSVSSSTLYFCFEV